MTGSRLPVTSAGTVAPVIVLTSRDLERSGADSLAKVLQSLPMNTGSPVNTNVDTGLGAARVNLRGLGSERTLVLLNGRRFPNGGIGGDASVDLNYAALVVDRARGSASASGASAVHGSDAVGGVDEHHHATTIIQGLTWAAVGTSPSAATVKISSGRGLRGLQTVGGAWGLGIDYANEAARDRSAREAIRRGRSLSWIRRELWVLSGRMAFRTGSSLFPQGMRSACRRRYLRLPDVTGQTASDYRPFTRGDSFNVAPYNYSQTPNERGSVWLLGSRPISGRSSFFIEALVHERKSSQQAAPDQYITISDPLPGLPTAPPAFQPRTTTTHSGST